jgi:selenide,water dikinase
VLVSNEREYFHYAMAAGLVRGAYSPDDLRVDAAALADRAGVRLVQARASRIAVDERVVIAGSERIPFEACSIDVIDESDGRELPGVARYALDTRPPSALLSLRHSIQTRLEPIDRSANCVIVGGGTLGIELAFTLLKGLRESEHGGVVTIVDGVPSRADRSSECHDLARIALEREGACFVIGASVVEVLPNAVRLSSGGTLPADVVLWATAARPPGLIVDGGLPHDGRGALLVDEHLRSSSGAPVWAAGDSTALPATLAYGADEDNTQGRLLEYALRSVLSGRSSPPRFERPSKLCLIDTGDGRALIFWRALRGRSRLAWWLKRRRDRRFVANFRQL